MLPVNGLYAVNDIRYFRDMFLKELNHFLLFLYESALDPEFPFLACNRMAISFFKSFKSELMAFPLFLVIVYQKTAKLANSGEFPYGQFDYG